MAAAGAGLPVGGDLEYAGGMTLGWALTERIKMVTEQAILCSSHSFRYIGRVQV